MASSMKDALRRAGLAAKEPPRAKPSRTHREELPDDETLPPLFDAPALTVPRTDDEPAPKRK